MLNTPAPSTVKQRCQYGAECNIPNCRYWHPIVTDNGDCNMMVALSDFNSTEAGRMNFCKGDEMIIIDNASSTVDWLYAQNQRSGQFGLVPQSHVLKKKNENSGRILQQKTDLMKFLQILRTDSVEQFEIRRQSLIQQLQHSNGTDSETVLWDKIGDAQEQYNTLVKCYDFVEQQLKWVTTLYQITKLKNLVKQETHQYKAALPIYGKKGEILQAINEHRVTVITAETGSGKSTQLVQYLLENITVMELHRLEQQQQQPTTSTPSFPQQLQERIQRLRLQQLVEFTHGQQLSHQPQSQQQTQQPHDLEMNKLIVCTQPRKIAVMSLAQRVAEEMGEQAGATVGFKAGVKELRSNNTKIFFCTDTTLLMELLKDRLLQRYSYVIVDEAHERSLNTDVLLGMLKRCLLMRPDIKVIITSATIDPSLFFHYFLQFGCKILQVPGRIFKVETQWIPPQLEDEDILSNYLDRVVDRVNHICDTDVGDILAFLTDANETNRAEIKLRELRADKNDVEVLQLHGNVMPEDQQRVYEKVGNYMRKVIFATNFAETSITIPGIKHVVDCGLVKEPICDQIRGTSILKVGPISQSSANQRQGRAGRTAAGMCHRLYSEEVYEQMNPSFVPEILRVNLSKALLILLQHQIEDIMNFDFIQKPDSAALDRALSSLKHLAAVNENNTLTELGKKMAQLSTLEPRYSKLVLESFETDQQIGILSLILSSCASVGNLFYRSVADEQKNKKAIIQKLELEKIGFCHEEGDAISSVNLFLQWNNIAEREKNQWCVSHFVNAKSMRAARDVFNETEEIIARQRTSHIDVQNMDSHISPESSFLLRSLILKCFDINLARYSGHLSAGYYNGYLDEYLHIHPSSALASWGNYPAWVVFDYTMETSRKFMFNVTQADEIMLDVCGIDRATRAKCQESIVKAADLDIGEKMKQKLSKAVVRWEMEASIAKATGSACVIESQNKDPLFNRMKIYTTDSQMTNAKKMVEQYVVDIRNQLEAETLENPIKGRNADRVVMGNGGQTIGLLWPEEFISIDLKNISSEVDEDRVKQYLEEQQIRPARIQKHNVSQSQSWKIWRITFITPEQAQSAFEILKNSTDIEAEPFKFSGGIALSATEVNYLSFELSWCRRHPKPNGFLNLHDDNQKDVIANALYLNLSNITGWSCKIYTKKANSIMIHGVATTSESEFRQAVDQCLAMHELANSYKSCALGREKGFETSAVTIKELEGALLSVIRNTCFLSNIESATKIRQPYVSAVNYTADLIVPARTSEEDAKLIDSICGRILYMGSQPIEVKIKVTIIVGSAVFEAIKNHFLKASEELSKSYQGLRCLFLPSKYPFKAEICATSGDAIKEAKQIIGELSEGVKFDCKNFPVFFSLSDTDFLKKFCTKFNIFAKSCKSKCEIVFHGNKTDINLCIAKIADFENERSRNRVLQVEIPLNQPRGLIKQILQQFDHKLDNLQSNIGLDNCFALQWNFINHSIIFHGTQLGYNNILELRNSCTNRLQLSMFPVNEDPECPVCRSIESDSYYCLKNCGHYYCQNCIDLLIDNALKSKEFPVSCAKESCEKYLSVSDFWAMRKNGILTFADLAEASVDCYLNRNAKDYRMCITADCTGVFRTSNTGQFSLAHCHICQVSICTSCGEQPHGTILSCEANKDLNKSSTVILQWLAEDPLNRKICPQCKTGIEKNGGCKHMTCRSCQAHFCWVCMEVLDKNVVGSHWRGNDRCGSMMY